MKTNHFTVTVLAKTTANNLRRVSMCRSYKHNGTYETRTPQDFVLQALNARKDKGSAFLGCGITCVFLGVIFVYVYNPDYPNNLIPWDMRIPALEN